MFSVRTVKKFKRLAGEKQKVLWTWKEQLKGASRNKQGTKQDAERGRTGNYSR